MADVNSNEPVSSVAIGKSEISLIALSLHYTAFFIALSVSSSVFYILF